MKPTICIIKTRNITVTFHNFDLFISAFKECGFSVFETFSRREALKNEYDYYLASDLVTALKLISRKKRYFYWMQGIAPEESVLEGKTKIHYLVWSIIEKIVIKHSLFVWAVGREMIKHLERKYKLSILQKASIFPCYNVSLDKKSFFSDGKYSNNIFVYAGGLSPWQCFEEIVNIYKTIEEKYDNVSFLILAREKQKALEIVKASGIKRYAIDYVSLDKLNSILATAKFGFIIRKNNLVNNVSTPTKISSYLSNGIIPIFTSSIKDFADVVKHNKYTIQFDSHDFQERIDHLLTSKIDPTDIYNNYSSIFEGYYNDDKYIDSIKQSIYRVTKHQD